MPPLFLFLLLTLAWPAEAPQQPPQASGERGPFLLAALRRDGVVSPFASFDGKEWDAPWPTDLRWLVLPINLESIPAKWWGKAGLVGQMTAWSDGVNRGTFRLSRPITTRLMCASRLGLMSDYRSAQPPSPPAVQPFPKDGLAISGSQTVGPIEVLSPASSAWAREAGLLVDPVNKAEEAAIRLFTDWDHPVSRTNRRTVAVEIEAMYGAAMDEPGWTAFYVEAVKRYAPGPRDEDCGLVTVISGWIMSGPDEKRTTKLIARVTYCDRRGVAYMLPFGLVKAGGRNYWAYQLSGYGREGYAVARPTPKGVEQEVQYSAGTCPL